jgi:hypothetical protein
MTDRFEIQVTVVDLAIKKTIYDRKRYGNSLEEVSIVIDEMGYDFDLTPQSDQSRQEIQYNETRTVAPQSLRERVRAPSRVGMAADPETGEIATIEDRNAEEQLRNR